MRFEDHFDSILCINLAHRTDRWAEAQHEAARLGITKLQRFSAVGGQVDHLGQPSGHMGAAKSHIAVWREIATGKHGEVVLVFEDDFLSVTAGELLRAGFPASSDEVRIFSELHGESLDPPDRATWLSARFEAMYREVPIGWDILFLGGGYQRKPFALVAPHVVRTAGMLGLHAYAMTRAAAATIVEDLPYFFPREDYPLPIDGSFLIVYARFMHFYVTSPRLFVQRASKSSIVPDVPLPKHFSSSYVDAAHERMVGR